MADTLPRGVVPSETPGAWNTGRVAVIGQQPMSNTDLTAQERAERRAEWESFAFSVPASGTVNVANHSHGTPTDHTYTVDVRGEKAVTCTCPADEHHPGPCKHRQAVENKPAVLRAASMQDSATDPSGRPDDCNCPDGGADADLPCWPCYRDGFDGGGDAE